MIRRGQGLDLRVAVANVLWNRGWPSIEGYRRLGALAFRLP